MILPGLRLPAFFPATSATANMLSESGAIDRPGFQRVVLEHHLEVDRERDHHPAERDLLERLGRDPEPEVLRLEEARVDQRRLALALALPEPPGERAEADDADREQRADRRAALLPDQDPEHDAAHAEDGEDRAHDVDLRASPCTARRGRAGSRRARSR